MIKGPFGFHVFGCTDTYPLPFDMAVCKSTLVVVTGVLKLLRSPGVPSAEGYQVLFVGLAVYGLIVLKVPLMGRFCPKRESVESEANLMV
ncbi:hypothetical protein SASPL_108147 [Salvia splendens]|uniref:Uncharacterized protein n=1 Tax=Salvia splendens TaxID=180675 RepID=A0A8X8YCH9_SALSN|nr:hypothetical protein SASPL_108147 [Salvia splendens]